MIFRHLPCKQLRQGPDPPAQTQSKSQPRPWDAQLLSSTAKKKKDLRRGNSWDNSQPQSQLHIKRHAQSERWVGIWGFYWAEGTWSLHTECRAQEAAPICSWERGHSQGLWLCKAQLGTARCCSDLPLSSCLQWPWNNTYRQTGWIRWWATLSWRWTITSCYQQHLLLRLCLLTHHICKSHIPKNKAKILLLVSLGRP